MPTAIRTAMKWGEDIPAEYDLSSLRLLGTVGEAINPEAWAWFHEHIGGGRCPIVDTWWQTETGAHMMTPLPGVTVAKPGSAWPAGSAEAADDEGLRSIAALHHKATWPHEERSFGRPRRRHVPSGLPVVVGNARQAAWRPQTADGEAAGDRSNGHAHQIVPVHRHDARPGELAHLQRLGRLLRRQQAYRAVDLRRVAAGGTALDPEVVSVMVTRASRGDGVVAYNLAVVVDDAATEALARIGTDPIAARA